MFIGKVVKERGRGFVECLETSLEGFLIGGKTCQDGVLDGQERGGGRTGRSSGRRVSGSPVSSSNPGTLGAELLNWVLYTLPDGRCTHRAKHPHNAKRKFSTSVSDMFLSRKREIQETRLISA